MLFVWRCCYEVALASRVPSNSQSAARARRPSTRRGATVHRIGRDVEGASGQDRLVKLSEALVDIGYRSAERAMQRARVIEHSPAESMVIHTATVHHPRLTLLGPKVT